MDCQDCQALFGMLTAATEQHTHAIGQLSLALLQHDESRMKVLHRKVQELEATREQCLNAWRRHREAHCATGLIEADHSHR
jgi:hypothetical protein